MTYGGAIRPAIPAILLLGSAGLAACGGGNPTTGPGGGGPAVASVRVSPGEASADAVETTVQFQATARDPDGGELTGVTFTWSSSDPSVATVSPDGLATALANGTVEVVAEAEGEADTARLVINQRADAVALSPASVTFQAAGDTARLAAEAADANGHPVADASFTWSSSDRSVATVDGEGLVTAEAEGLTDVSARADGVEDSSSVRVGLPPSDPPTIASVSPTPLTEGGTAVLDGSDFDPVGRGDTVLVDGVEAAVTSASSSTLEITVPDYDCLPARDVVVEVRTAAGGDQVSSPLDPEETPVSLAPGEQLLVEDPADFCLQFAGTASSERYLLGVQFISTAALSLQPVTITSEAADGSGAASAAPVSLAAEGEAGGGFFEPEPSPRLAAHREAEMRLRRWERRNLDPAASLPARGGSTAPEPSRLVGGGVQEGDTVSVRVPDAAADNACASFSGIGAEVKAIGTRGIFVADTANPSGGFTDADYQDFSDRMDADIFATLVDYFGNPSDLDSNGHVVVVISKEVNLADPDILGFVFSGDFFSRTACPSSDQGEFYYGKAPDPDGDLGPSYTTDRARLETPFVMSHELTHVVQQSRRFQASQDFMGPVVAEAQATLGEEVVGHSVTGRSTGQDYGFDVAFNPGGTDEIDWYLNGFVDLVRYFGFESETSRVADAPDECGWWQADPSPCVSRSLWYGVGWSFLRWASDQFGPAYPGGEQGFHRDVIGSGGRGPQNVATVLGRPFQELMAQWAASLYVDGRVTGPDPVLTLPSWDLFDVEQNTVATAHLQPVEMDFTDWRAVGELRASSAGYVSVEQAGRPPTAVRVRDGSDRTLLPAVQIWLVRLE